MDINDIQTIIGSHNKYWDKNKRKMQQYAATYRGEMLTHHSLNVDTISESLSTDRVVINTPDGQAHIEGYMGSLYPKAPAVNVGPDATNKGSPDVAQKVVNRFLYDQSIIIQNGMRNALIFPNSFFKLGVIKREQAVDSITMKNIDAWDVIVDTTASIWQEQRYIGHRYFIPTVEAKRKWSGVRWRPTEFEEYLAEKKDEHKQEAVVSTSDYLSSVEIFEIYNLLEDELIFYSPNLDRHDKIIEKTTIPFRSFDNSPICPIAPLYFTRDPQTPLKGLSELGKIYDALYEKNSLRTFYANSVRQDTRQYLVKKGTLDSQAISKLQNNIDNQIIEVQIADDANINNVIVPIRTLPTSQDYSIYKMDIEKDLEKGTLLAPFTRGQATNSTATEVAALTSYTSSQIGKFARERDVCIEYISQIYISVLASILECRQEEQDTVEQIVIDGSPITLVYEDFLGKFKFSAQDQGSTPVSSALKRQQFMALVPILEAYGVDKKEILSKMIKDFELPDAFIMSMAQAPQQIMPETLSDTQLPEEIPKGGGEQAQAIREGSLPE